MMALSGVATGSANGAKAGKVAGASAETGIDALNFADAQQQSRAQLAATSAAADPETTGRPPATKAQADGELVLDDELNLRVNGKLVSGTNSDTSSDTNTDSDAASAREDAALKSGASVAEELLGAAIVDEAVADDAIANDAVSEAGEPLAEPSAQLWHWHYSRQARAEQAQASAGQAPVQTEQITTEQTRINQARLEPANAGQTNAAQATAGQISAGQTSANQARAEAASAEAASAVPAKQASVSEVGAALIPAERGQGVSGQAVSSLPASASDKGMAASFFVTQATSNKLLLQQLGPSVAMAGSSHNEEASSLQTHTLASLVTGANHGRAGVPVHEWASVTLDASNKSTLGMQLVQALKEKVELQLNQEVQQARIKLDPPEMGRLELSIRLEGDKLHIHINASNGAVRDALNAQADRLRNDLLAQHTGGVEVSVGQEGQSQQSSSPQFDNAILLAEQASTELEQKQQAGSGWINALV